MKKRIIIAAIMLAAVLAFVLVSVRDKYWYA